MKTSDMTLRMFLEQYRLGRMDEISDAVKIEFGHTEHTAAETEVLIYTLERPFEDGELPSLAAAYLLRSGFVRISIMQQPLPDDAIGDLAACADLEKGYMVFASSDEKLFEIHITVTYNEKVAFFSKHASNSGL